MFQMALRRLVVQTRRLLHDRKWSKSRAAGQLDDYVTAQFLHRPLPRGNAYALMPALNLTRNPANLSSMHVT